MNKRIRIRPGDTGKSIALIRASTEDQRLSPDAQRAAIEAWATKRSIEILAWHVESGVSGATPIEQRLVLLAAIDDVARHGAGHLVVSRRDRLARDVVLVGLIERLVTRAGGKVSSADGVELDGPEGALMRGIVDVFASYERLVIASRTKAALAAKRSRGERTGMIPFGFSVGIDGTKLVVSDKEQAVIEIVGTLRANGLTLRAVVKECERIGLVSRSGKPLGLSQVERIIRKLAA